ncbi:MAG: energy transducer TonB [Silanimonas sp.]
MSTRKARHRRTGAVLTTGLLAAVISTTAIAGRSQERPGVGVTPAFVCIATTVLADGRTDDARIVRRSGNGLTDIHALRFVRSVNFRPPGGTTWETMGMGERAAHVLVRMHQNGTLAFKLYELDDPLPPICGTPFESVARDREINATTTDLIDE